MIEHKANDSKPPSGEKESHDPGHSLVCSWLAGSFQQIGNVLLQSTAPVDIVKKQVGQIFSTSNPSANVATSKRIENIKVDRSLARPALKLIVPGFFSFETHHIASHFLFAKIKGSEITKPPTPPGVLLLWDKAVNHSLHFLAGAAGGLSYGLALAVVEQTFSVRAMRGHILGHGALFGGYDCFSDVLSERLPDNRPVATAFAGGLAGVTQGWTKDAVGGVLHLSPKVVASRFFPGAAAFTAYEYTRYVFVGSSQKEH